MVKRVGFALNGVRLCIHREHSFRTHLVAMGLVLLVLLVTRPAAIWWAIIALAVGLVLVAEVINTALETLAQHLHPERHPEIGAAKDIAAGAVLIASLVALCVGLAFAVDYIV